MSAYPTTPPWRNPVIRSLSFSTAILAGVNGTEQRWMRSTGVESWTLPYTRLTVAKRDILFAAFEAAKGAYDQTISLQFDADHNYTGLYFDADSLSFTEDSPTVFSGTVKLCTVVRTADSGTLPTDFPLLSTGAPSQRPYTKSSDFDTVSVRTEGGRFAYPRRSSALHTWTVGGAAITTTEAQAIWDMFRLAGGMLQAFAYTDADSTTRYTKCRFGADSIEWRMLGPNQNSIVTTVKELV